MGERMTPQHWNHTRRSARPKHTDPFDALIHESADAAASGKLLRAARLLRYVEQLRRLRKPRSAPLIIERAPLPSPPAATPAPLPVKRPNYTEEEKAELTRLYRLGGIAHLMAPFE
jgi:hypothetical protein